MTATHRFIETPLYLPPDMARSIVLLSLLRLIEERIPKDDPLRAQFLLLTNVQTLGIVPAEGLEGANYDTIASAYGMALKHINKIDDQEIADLATHLEAMYSAGHLDMFLSDTFRMTIATVNNVLRRMAA